MGGARAVWAVLVYSSRSDCRWQTVCKAKAMPWCDVKHAIKRDHWPCSTYRPSGSYSFSEISYKWHGNRIYSVMFVDDLVAWHYGERGCRREHLEEAHRGWQEESCDGWSGTLVWKTEQLVYNPFRLKTTLMFSLSCMRINTDLNLFFV